MFLLGVRELGLSGHIIWSKRKRKKAYFLSKQSGYQVPGTILSCQYKTESHWLQEQKAQASGGCVKNYNMIQIIVKVITKKRKS